MRHGQTVVHCRADLRLTSSTGANNLAGFRPLQEAGTNQRINDALTFFLFEAPQPHRLLEGEPQPRHFHEFGSYLSKFLFEIHRSDLVSSAKIVLRKPTVSTQQFGD